LLLAAIQTLILKSKALQRESEESLQYLHLLNRRACVTDAALYVLGQGPQHTPSRFGNEQNLPENCSSEIEMVALAMERKTIVTIPEFWQRRLVSANYLITTAAWARRRRAGVPDCDQHAVLSFNQKTVIW
jgi:hypothetical protein